MKRLMVVLFAAVAIFLGGFAAIEGTAEARRCPRGYYKKCGAKRCYNSGSYCKRYRRGRCVRRVVKRRCKRTCYCKRY